jgi:hypothetical protein
VLIFSKYADNNRHFQIQLGERFAGSEEVQGCESLSSINKNPQPKWFADFLLALGQAIPF